MLAVGPQGPEGPKGDTGTQGEPGGYSNDIETLLEMEDLTGVTPP